MPSVVIGNVTACDRIIMNHTLIFFYCTQAEVMPAFVSHGAITADAHGRSVVVEDSSRPARLFYDATLVKKIGITAAAPKSIAFSPNGALYARLSGSNVAIHCVPTHSTDGQHFTTLFGHTNRVTSVEFHPNGTTIATGSWDMTAKLWCTHRGTSECVVTLAGHTDAVTAVAFSPDGAVVATASADSTAKLWCVSCGKLFTTLVHSDRVTSVMFSPNSTTVVTGSCDKTAKLWRASDGTLIKTLEGHTDAVTAVAFEDNGDVVVTGSTDTTAKIWRVNDGDCIATLPGNNRVIFVVCTLHGVLLATPSRVCFWNVAYRRVEASVTVSDFFDALQVPASDGCYTSVAFSREQSLLVRCQSDANGSFVLFSRIVSKQCNFFSSAFDSDVKCVAFSRGSTVAFGDNTSCRVLETAVGRSRTFREKHIVKCLATVPEGNTGKPRRVNDGVCIETFEGHTRNVIAVAFSPDGNNDVAVPEGNTEKLRRVNDGDCIETFEGHTRNVVAVAFSPDGNYVVTVSEGNSGKLQRVSDGVCTVTFKGHTHSVVAVAFSPDGSLLATGSRDKTARLWSVADGSCIMTLTGHKYSVTSVAFSPDGQLLATGSLDKTAKLWSLSNCSCVGTLAVHTDAVTSVAFSPDSATLVTSGRDETRSCVATLKGHTNAVICVAFSSDGALLATGSSDGTANLWHVAGKACTATLIVPDLHAVAFSPTDGLIATATTTGIVKFWCAVNGVYAATTTHYAESVADTSIAFSADGAMFLTGCGRYVHAFMVPASPWTTIALKGHTCEVTSIDISPDGTLIATGSKDKTVKLWRLTNGECTATLSGHADDITCVAFSADSSLVATAAADKSVKLWRSAGGILVGASTFSVVAEALFFDLRGVGVVVGCRSGGVEHRVTLMALQENTAKQFMSSLRRGEVVVGKLVGSGSSSTVHEATWRKTVHALKIFRLDAKLELQRELAMATYLQHPNIVRVVAVVTDDNDPLLPVGLLMELAQQSINDAIAALHPTTSTVAKWLCELAQAIEFAHHCGVVHSDIKPDNVLMTACGSSLTAKLADFGSSFKVSEIDPTVALEPRGTPMFIAPEYAISGTPSTASDVFSFGMTMWCVLCPRGTDHGLGMSDAQISYSLELELRPPLDGIEFLSGLIAQCWAVEPDARPSIEVVVAELRAEVHDESLNEARDAHQIANATPHEEIMAPSVMVWSSLLSHASLEVACSHLEYTNHNGVLLSSRITALEHPCYQFVCSAVGPGFDLGRIRGISMVGHSDAAAAAFVNLHNKEAHSRATNPELCLPNPSDAASVAAINRLKQAFVPPPRAEQTEKAPKARMLLAWHGTPLKYVTDVCRDGPRSLRTTDVGFFGAGSYFALEAQYVSVYSRGDELTMVLFAVSVSQAKAVTPELDYVDDRGYSRYYPVADEKACVAVSLSAGYDAHFIPVANYDNFDSDGMFVNSVHPRTGKVLVDELYYQAVDISKGVAEAHELVIDSHHRCVPLAVVYFR